MPVRNKEKLDGTLFLAHLRQAHREINERNLAEALLDTTPREIYEATGLESGLQREVVDGLIRFALEDMQLKPYRPLRAGAINMLVDGHVLFFRASAQDDWVVEDPHIIVHDKVKFRNEELRELMVEYPTKETGPTGKTLWFRCFYYYGIDNSPKKDVAKYEEGATEEQIAEVTETVDLQFWPYAGVQWVDPIGIIQPVKVAIMAYEVALHNIAIENGRHSRRRLVLKGVSKVDDAVEDSAEEGRLFIPRDGDAYYPNTYPDGVRLMFDELHELEERIRRTTGNLKVADLHNASGVSRQYEVRDKLAVASDIRNKATEMMRRLNTGDDWQLSFAPLVELSPQDIEIAQRTLAEALANGAIDENEYRVKVRTLHNLDAERGPKKKAAPKRRRMVVVEEEEEAVA